MSGYSIQTHDWNKHEDRCGLRSGVGSYELERGSALEANSEQGAPVYKVLWGLHVTEHMRKVGEEGGNFKPRSLKTALFITANVSCLLRT